MLVSDRISGGFLVVLGSLAAYGGSRLPPVPGQDVGPAVFPMVIGIGLALTGAAIALGLGRSFEAPADAAPPPDQLPPLKRAIGGWAALLPPLLMLFYVVAVETLGFFITGALVISVSAVALGAGWRLTVPLALLGPAFVHLAFAKLLRVPLPDGLLGFPW